MNSKELRLQRKARINESLERIALTAPDLISRYKAIRSFSSQVRLSEYHLTNICNIRCKGCWFFEFGHDSSSYEVKQLDQWISFIEAQRTSRVNAALLIGGEPTVFPDRIAAFVERMKYVTISTNGLRKLPNDERFKNVGIIMSVFGGGPLDDELRAIRPSGKRFTGLFEKSLANYRNDPRPTFIFAVTERSLPYIEDVVRRIEDNGNKVTFNFYSQYHTSDPLRLENQKPLLDQLLQTKQKYPDTVLSHSEHIKGIVTGEAWCGTFSRETCPSISVDHPSNASRIENGHPVLTFFNTYKADLTTLEVCCTSGHCEDCRDSQAVYSWQLVNVDKALTSAQTLLTWIEVAESYWSQFTWSPYHWSKSSPSARERNELSILTSAHQF